jgi:hypothetical protein
MPLLETLRLWARSLGYAHAPLHTTGCLRIAPRVNTLAVRASSSADNDCTPLTRTTCCTIDCYYGTRCARSSPRLARSRGTCATPPCIVRLPLVTSHNNVHAVVIDILRGIEVRTILSWNATGSCSLACPRHPLRNTVESRRPSEISIGSQWRAK